MLNKWRLIQVNPEQCCQLTDSGRRGRGKCRRCHGNELYAIFTEYFSPASTYRIHVSIRDPGPSNSFYRSHTAQFDLNDWCSQRGINWFTRPRKTHLFVFFLGFLSIIVKNIHMLVLFHVAQLWVLCYFLRKITKLSKDFYKTKTAVQTNSYYCDHFYTDTD